METTTPSSNAPSLHVFDEGDQRLNPLGTRCSTDPLKVNRAISLANSVGDTLPFEWTLRKRLEEHLSRIWPFGVGRTEQGKGSFDLKRAAEGAEDYGAVAGEQGWTSIGSYTKTTVDDIVEITGASADFAKHALRVSKVTFQHLSAQTGNLS